ncbi:MAG: hypothetical protein Q9175_000678 [Cornicularia normoerica]
MSISKTSAGHCSERTTSHQAKKATTVQPILHHNLSATENRRRSWTQEQLSNTNYLKVPASVWKNIHDPTRTEWIEAAENTLTSAVATGALSPRPNIGLVRVHKWFWYKSIETNGRKDAYRYRVIDQATNITILPENEWYDPVEDDETKIKILFVGLPFKDHIILLLRRICPDVNMDTIQTADQWRQYLSPSIREGFSQIRKSTTYGWPPIVNRKKSHNTHRPTLAALPRSKKSPIRNLAR